ncbi:MAG: glycerol-3-phosphate dehydrogenase [Lentisphaeria bacterium]|nr:glycerol-3-phosphate dehydrogenase [Lentisphaeria bacterium]
MSTITIIGAGMMGSAMSGPAADNGHQVRLVGTPLDRTIIESVRKSGFHPTLHKQLPEAVTAYQAEELDRALDGAELVIGGVSSFGVDWFSEAVLPLLRPGVPVLSVTKGLLDNPDGTLTPFPHLLASRLPEKTRGAIRFNAIGGPCICFELLERRHTMVHFCGEERATLDKIRKMLATDYYHILPTTDVAGVEGCVALKNAYAMGVSLAVGIADREVGELDAAATAALCAPGAPDRNPVYNPQAALFAQSCLEMRRIVERMGGNGALAGELPGAGDLYVTIFGGRTRRLGTLLGRGIPFAEAQQILKGVTLEAVAIITRVARALRAAKADPAEFPLMLHMDAVLNRGAGVDLPWESFGR